MYYIGIDLGTSSVKGIMTDSSGAVLRETSADYDVLYPHDGWSEQHPEDWLKATEQVLKKLSDGVAEKIGGISVGGQMHGLVILDKDDKVIRPCILWNDGRTEKQTRYLNGQIGEEKLCRRDTPALGPTWAGAGSPGPAKGTERAAAAPPETASAPSAH